jgi:hypothetical protein
MKLGTWNVRNLYRAGLRTTAAMELARYELYLVGVQVKWDNEDTVRAGDYIFFYGKGNEYYQPGTVFFVHYRIVSTIKRVRVY